MMKKVMCGLSDAGQLGIFFVFLVAKKLDSPTVGSMQSISFHSRKPVIFGIRLCQKLVTSGILIKENVNYIVKNFEKRQEPVDATERSRQSRKNKNDATQMQRKCNDVATIRHGEKEEEKEIETETETEIETEKEEDPSFSPHFLKFL